MFTFCQITLDWQWFLGKSVNSTDIKGYLLKKQKVRKILEQATSEKIRVKLMSEQRPESELCLHSHIHLGA